MFRKAKCYPYIMHPVQDLSENVFVSKIIRLQNNNGNFIENIFSSDEATRTIICHPPHTNSIVCVWINIHGPMIAKVAILSIDDLLEETIDDIVNIKTEKIVWEKLGKVYIAIYL